MTIRKLVEELINSAGGNLDKEVVVITPNDTGCWVAREITEVGSHHPNQTIITAAE